MFRMMLAASAWLVLTALPALAADKADKSKLVGTWNVTGAAKDGKVQAKADVKDKTVKITKDTITCYDSAKKTEMECTYTVDDSGKTWNITMKCTKGEHKDKTLKGIAKLDGDTLQICFSKPDQAAPTGFTTKEGQCLFTLTRAK